MDQWNVLGATVTLFLTKLPKTSLREKADSSTSGVGKSINLQENETRPAPLSLYNKKVKMGQSPEDTELEITRTVGLNLRVVTPPANFYLQKIIWLITVAKSQL